MPRVLHISMLPASVLLSASKASPLIRLLDIPSPEILPLHCPLSFYITNPSLLVHFPQQFAKTRLVMPRESLGSLISFGMHGGAGVL